MREIKFRAWDLAGEKLRSVAFLEFDASSQISNVALRVEPLDTNKAYSDRFENRSNGDDLVLMQFTGCNDKNGKEIYEDDIVIFLDGSQIPYVVKWNIHQSAWYWGNFDQVRPKTAEQIEVIGNLYENPELLKS